MGNSACSVTTPALLVIPNHTCSNPCFNLLCWFNTRAARAVLGAPSFLLPMTRRMQKAQLFTHQGDRGGLCLGIGFQLLTFSCQSLKHFAVCKQFYGDLFFFFFLKKHFDPSKWRDFKWWTAGSPLILKACLQKSGHTLLFSRIIGFFFFFNQVRFPLSLHLLLFLPTPNPSLLGLKQRKICQARPINSHRFGIVYVLMWTTFQSTKIKQLECSFPLPSPWCISFATVQPW